MTMTYNVHIYRELRLAFSGIEADSHAEAAAIAREMPTEAADSIDDCEGHSFAALVDVQGHEDRRDSRVVLFAEGLLRKSSSKRLAALKAFIEMDDMAERCGEWKWESLSQAFALAREAVAEATDDPEGD